MPAQSPVDRDDRKPFDARELRDCFGTFVTGVTVVTTVDAEGGWHGLTVNSFSSVSLDPPFILWSQRIETPSFPTFNATPHFAVNILAEDQVDISNRFASKSRDKFSGVDVFTGFRGLPLIAGCSAHFECSAEAKFPGGDHVVFLGRVERITNRRYPPLAFSGGRYATVRPLPASRSGEAAPLTENLLSSLFPLQAGWG